MSNEKSQQQTSTESTVASAAKTGKAISNIAKGAAAGGAHGAAIEAGKSSAKWLIPLIAAVLLPLILVAMLPSIIFGSLLGDGTDSPNGISNDEVLVQNMTAINEGISSILSEGLTDVLERIDSDFASSGCDGKEINNPFGADVVFNANAFVSQYCAHKDTEIASISKEDMEALLTANKDKLYSFAFTDEEREIPPEQGDEDSGETIHETIRIYTISYNGEAYFADQVFHLSDDQKLLASQYAQNLTALLGDGIYQGLSETEFSAMDLSYDGVVFADGETQVVYYNQLDERWKYSPYGQILARLRQEGLAYFSPDGQFLATSRYSLDHGKTQEAIMAFWAFIQMRDHVLDFCASEPPAILSFSSADKDYDLISGSQRNIPSINASRALVPEASVRLIVVDDMKSLDELIPRDDNDYGVLTGSDGVEQIYKL